MNPVAFILGFVVLLILIGGLILLLQEARTEVKPSVALVYNNIWTGTPEVVLPGTDFLVPGVHRVFEKEVSLKNEAHNPHDVKLITADGIELSVDYIVRRMQVGYPGMPKLRDPTTDLQKLQTAVIQAATAIKYDERQDKVQTRIVAHLQAALSHRTANELIPGTDMKTGEVGKVDKKLMQSIEDEVNKELLKDEVTTEWGFWVEIDLEDYDLPKTISAARESKSSAKMAGAALKEKAEAAGVDPKWLVLAESIAAIFGGKKKEESDK